MSSQTVVDVVISGTTATVVDAQVDGITTVAGAPQVTNVSGQIPDLGVNTDILATQGDILSLTNDVANLRANLIVTGTALTDEIGVLSGNLISSGNNLEFQISTLSGDLIASGNNLDSLRDILSGNLISTGANLEASITGITGDIATLTNNLVSTGNNLEDQIFNSGTITDDISGNLIVTGETLSSNLVSTGNVLDTERGILSGDLITTGQTLYALHTGLNKEVEDVGNNLIDTGNNLEPRIVSNLGAITSLQTETGILSSATGELQEYKFNKAGGTISGSILPSSSGTLNLGSESLPFKGGFFNDLTVSSNTLFIGDIPISTVDGGVDFSSATGTTIFEDVSIRNLTVTGTETIIDVDNLAIKDNKIILNSGESGAGISLVTGGIIIDRGTLTDADLLFNEANGRFEFNFPLALDGNLAVTANQTGAYADVSNLIQTGVTLQSQITSNDGDITSLTAATGELKNQVNTTDTNLITTGQALTDEIAIVSGIAGGSTFDELSGNLVTTGQTLTSEITIVSGIAEAHTDISELSGNLITTGQTLQTQITSNDSDISALTSNLIVTGSRIDTVSGNLITTGQTLQTQITSNDSDITTLTSNLVQTGVRMRNFLIETGFQVDDNTQAISDISSNLISTGQTLTSEISIVSGIAVAHTDVSALSGKVDEISGDLITTGSYIDSVSGNLISTGNNLQTQITSNDGEIAGIIGDLVNTGTTLTNNINTVSSNLVTTGSIVDNVSGNLITTGQHLTNEIVIVSGIAGGQDFDTLSGNLITTGQTLTTNLISTGNFLDAEIAIVSGLTTGSSSDPDLSGKVDTLSGNLITTGQTLQTQITSNDTDISNLTSNLITTGQTLTSEIAIVSGIATGGSAEDFAALSGNLITTGQTLQTQITSNDGDITSLTSNLITTGQTLTSEIGTVSGLITDNDAEITALLAATGELKTDTNRNASNLITTGQTLTTNINTVSTNLVSTGSIVDDISGNLITTGQTLQTQITSNDGDITNLTSNLITTGQTLTTEITTVSGLITDNDGDITALKAATGVLKTSTDNNTANLISTGAIVDDISGNLITSGQTLQTQITSNDSDISTLTTNVITTGQTLQTQITSNDGDISTLTSNLITTGQTLQTQITSNDSDISTLTSNLISTGSVVDDISGNLITTGQTLQAQITSNDSDISTLTSNLVTTGQTLTTNINTVSSNLVSTGSVVDDISGNLITTGQTLQTQITSNDGDISTLTTNLGTTGQTLQTQITSNDADIATLDSTTVKLTTNQSVAGNKIFTDTVTINNLTVTGTEVIVDVENLAVKDNIIHINSGESGAGISRISGGITIDRGTEPAANILYNDANDRFELNFPLATEGNVVASAANLITTGQTLTTNINTVSTNLVSTGSVVDDISGNLITTGQTLQTQITSNDTDITNLSSNLVTTGQTLTTNINTVANNLVTTGQTLTSEIATVSGLIPATVVDGAGVTGYTARWYDGNTLTTGALYDNGTKVGIGTNNPTYHLDVQDHTGPVTLRVRGGDTYDSLIRFDQASTQQATIGYDHSSSLLKLGNHSAFGNTNHLVIDTAGEVGIGTDAPQYALDVAGDVGFNEYIYHNGDNNTYIRFAPDLVNIVAGGWSALKFDKSTSKIQLNNSNQDLDVQVMGDDGAVILHTDAGTNRVGIGTNAPEVPLEVVFSRGAKTSLTDIWGLRSENTGDVAGTQAGLTFIVNNASSARAWAGIYAEQTNTDDTSLKFWNEKANSRTVKMTINSDGNVGIGSENPAYKLDVRGDYIFVDDGKGIRFGGSSHQVTRETGNELRLKAANTTGFITFLTGGGTEYMRIAADGKVGIGTTAPAALLDVRGTVKVGVDDAGHDVMLYGATSGRYWEWDQSMDLVRMRDNVKSVYGNGDDLQIYHDGSNSYITDSGTGDLKLLSSGLAIQSANGNEYLAYFAGTGGQTVSLYAGNSKKFETTSTGVSVTGQLDLSSHLDMPDNAWIKLGASDDLLITHDGSSSWIIDNGAGGLVIASDSFYIKNAAYNETGLSFIENGAVSLYYDNAVKLATNSGGVTVTGTAILGGASFVDNATAYFGTGNDLRIYHDGNHSYIKDAGTGSLVLATSRLSINNAASNEEMISAIQNGAVELFYANSKKLETTSTGVSVAGTGTFSGAVTLGNNSYLSNATTSSVSLNSSGDVLLTAIQSGAVFAVKTWNGSTQAERFKISGAGAIATTAITGNATVSGSLKATTILDTNNSAGTNGQVLVSTGAAIDWKTLAEISGVDGTGTAGYLSKWTDSDTIGNSPIYTDGTDVAIGSTAFGVGGTQDLSIGNPGTTTGGITLWSTTSATHSLGFGDANSGTARYEGYVEYSHGDNSMRLATSHAERVRITSDGKVGIGTTAPSARLEVEDGGTASSVILKVTADDQTPYALMVGNDTYSTTDTDGIGMWINNAGQGKLHARGTGSQLILGAAGTNYVYLLSDGNVGIGIASPTTKLSVKSTGSNVDEISLVHSGNTVKLVSLGQESSHGSIHVRANSGVAQARISAVNSNYFLQNVGIGTTAPTYKLHVASNGGYLAYFQNTSATDYRPVGFTDENNAVVGSIGYNTTNNVFSVGDTTGPVVSLVGGKVGIGTTAPLAKLHLKGSTATNEASHILFENTQGAKKFAVGGGGSGVTNNGLGFRNVTDNTLPMIIDDSGKVGIGTTAPSDLLHLDSSGHTEMSLDRGSTSYDATLKYRTAGTADWQIGTGLTGTDAKLTWYSSAAKMTLTTDGKLGIGTTAPSRPLSVHMSSAGSVANFLHYTDASNFQGLYIDVSQATDIVTLNNSGSHGGAAIDLQVSSASIMYLQGSGGKVGIGTTAPAKPVHVNVETGWATLRLEGASDSGGEIEFYKSSTKSGSIFFSAAGDCQIRPLGVAEKFIILANGNVGIGTAAPAGLLELEAASPSLILDKSETGGGALRFYKAGSQVGYIMLDASEEMVYYQPSGEGHYFYAGGQPALKIQYDGAIGIGTPSPGVVGLDVQKSSASIIASFLNSHSTGYGVKFKATAGQADRYIATFNDKDDAIKATITGTGQVRSLSGALSAPSFSFTNDTTTGMSRPTTGTLNFVTAGTERVRIAADGNVGIGTNAPSADLEVSTASGGELLVTRAGNSGVTLQQMNGGDATSGSLSIKVGTAMHLYTNGTGRALTIDSSQKVGIGTDAPAAKLQVTISDAQDSGAKAARFTNATGDCGVLIEGTNDNTSGAYGYGRSGGSLILENKSDTAGNYNTIAFVNSDGFGYAGIQSPCYTQGGTGVTEGGLEFWVRNAGSNYHRAVTINEDGVLDVRSSKFKIGGSAGSSGQTLTTDGSGNISWSSAGSGTISGSGTDDYIPRFNGTSAIHNSIMQDNGSRVLVGGNLVSSQLQINHDYSILYYYKADGTTMLGYLLMRDNAANYLAYTTGQDFAILEGNTRRLTIRPTTGSVGIGTDTPTANLHIKPATGNSRLKLESDNTSADVEMMLDSANSTRNAHITFYNAGVQKGGVGYASSDAIMKMWGGNNPADDHLCINSAGSVGIGTASPEAALTVAGPNYTHAIFRTNQSTASQRAGGGFSSLGHATATSRFARLFLDADGANFSGTDYFTIEKFGNSGEVKFLQYSNATMSFWVNTTTQAMTIKNDGNVGIGTTAPSNLLSIHWAAGGYAKLAYATNQYAGLVFVENGVSKAYIDYGGYQATDGFSFYAGGGSNAHLAMKIKESGKTIIGGGATEPGACRLTVNGSGGFGSSSDGVIISNESGYGVIQGTDMLGNSFNGLKLRTQGYAIIIPNSAAPDVEIVNKLGIGVVAPQAKTDIVEIYADSSSAVEGLQLLIRGGQADLTPTGDSIGLGFGYGSANNYVKTGIINEFTAANGTSSLHLCTTATGGVATVTKADARLTVKSDGNVGIGTNAPLSPLHVQQYASGNYTGEVRLGGVNTAHGMLLSYTQISNTEGSIHVAPGYANSNALFKLRCSTNNTNQLVLKGDGKIGIGTDAPAWDLTLYKSGGTLGVVGAGSPRIDVMNTGGSKGLRIEKSADAYSTLTNYDGGAGASLTLQGASAGGNVGIGTTAPGKTLDVNGDIRIRGDAGKLNFYRSTSPSDIAYIQYNNGSSRLDIAANNKDIVFMNENGPAESMRIDNSGNVGIGSASPAAPLDVPRASDYKVIKLGDDITSHYVMTGNSDHTLTLTCASYFQAEIVITAHQTNGGTYNNLYMRGIWSNNHTSHHWDEIENVGDISGSTFTITVGQNGATTNSGEWKIVHDYTSGTFVKFTVRVTDFYNTHSYTIS